MAEDKGNANQLGSLQTSGFSDRLYHPGRGGLGGLRVIKD